MLSRRGSARSAPRNPRVGRWLAAALLLLGGCAVHVQGLVAPADGKPTLTTIEGRRYGLVLLGDAAALSRLDGHLVEVDGQRAFGVIRVGGWRILEGTSGMGTWVGRVALMGSQVGFEAREGGFYWVDDATAPVLRAYAGELVLVEGYVDGPHHVQALSIRALERADPPR